MTREELTAKIAERMTERGIEYKKYAKLEKSTLLEIAKRHYRVSDLSMKTSKSDLISFILDATLSVDTLERRLAKMS
jgi:hypothetical protein